MQNLIDLQTYPLDQPDSPAYAALVARCKADLAQEGMFDLAGFLLPAAIAKAVSDLAPKAETQAFKHSRQTGMRVVPARGRPQTRQSPGKKREKRAWETSRTTERPWLATAARLLLEKTHLR